MKNIFKMAIAVFLTVLILTSCSEDSTNPSDDNSNNSNINPYFPYKIGSEAVYKSYNLDDNDNLIDTTMSEYKTIAKEKQTIKDKEALIFENQKMNGEKIGSSTMSINSTQIFMYFKLLPEMDIDLPIEIAEDWYLIFDLNKTRWDLYSKYIDNETINFGNFNIILQDTFKIYVTYDGTENVTWGENNDKTDEAKVYTINYEYMGKASTAGLPIQIPFKAKNHYYYVENLGLVKTKFDNVYVSFLSSNLKIIGGFVDILQSINHP